jgi:F5/8 type C domain-containing protein
VRDTYRRIAVSFVFYCVVTLVLFRPLLAHITNAFPHDPGDPVLSAWALWWNAHHVPFTRGWWDGGVFYPEHGSLAFSDHRVGLGLIASPILWLGGGPVLAHNVVFLLSFPLCAIAAHLLARTLTGSDLAGVIAGLTFGFNPYRVDHLAHLELLAAWWLPVAFLALHWYLRDGRVRWLALFASSLALQGLSCGYYFFFAVPLIAAWILWFVPPFRRMLAIGIAWAAAIVPLVPALLGYHHFLERLNLFRRYDEIRFYSADITGLLSASPMLAMWHSTPALHRPEGDIFPGVFAVALVIAAVLLSLSRPSGAPTRLRHVQLGCVVLAIILEMAGLTSLLRPWSLRLLGVTISAHDLSRPATVAAALLAVAALISPTGLAALRRRSPLAFYAGAAGLMWLFALGPVPMFLGERALFHGPYAYLMSLPGFGHAFRVPARFAMLMAFNLSIAAALAFTRVTGTVRVSTRRALGVCVAGAILLDGWIAALPVVAAPEAWRPPAEITRAAAVLELPVGGDFDEIAAVWRSIDHGKPVVNGYSGYDPPHHRLLRRAIERHDRAVLSGVAEYGPILVAIDAGREDAAFWRAAFSDARIATTTQPGDRWTFVWLPRAAPRVEAAGTPLPIVSGSANAGHFELRAVTDGDPSTRWSTNRFQRGDEQLLLQLDRVRRVSGVILSMGAIAEDYPRRLRIETSVDGRTWSVGWDESPAGLAFSAILRNALNARLSFRIPDAESRYVRLRQLDADNQFFWGMSDVTIVGQ